MSWNSKNHVYKNADGALVDEQFNELVPPPSRSVSYRNGVLLYGEEPIFSSAAILRAAGALSIAAALPPPTRVTPLRATTTYYINPAYDGSNGAPNGTLSRPWLTLAASFTANAPAAGQQHLLAKGSTLTLTTLLQFAPTGTLSAANPFVIGVYEPLTGERLTAVGTGLATINVNNTATVGCYWTNANFICIDGIRFINATGAAAHGLVTFEGTSANCQILNCDLSSGLANGVYINGSGLDNVVEGCRAVSNSSAGVYLVPTATGANLRVTYNNLRGNAGHGFAVYHPAGTYTYVGTVACNAIYGGHGTAGAFGVYLFAGGGAAKVYLNDVRRYVVGIRGSTAAAASVDATGALIQNNIVDRCEMGIEVSGWRNLWIVESNRCSYCGSFDGINPITPGPTAYGRGIEIFAATDATASRDGIVRWNECYGSYSWLSNASEGVGIGLDNRCYYVSVYGNHCHDNEGHGIQCNQNLGYCTIEGNLLVNNNIAPLTRGVIHTAGSGTEICTVLSPSTRVRNNTIVMRGGANQSHGIADSPTYPSIGLDIRNNLIVSPSISGIVRTVASSTEQSNIVEDCRVAVMNGSLAAVASGAGTLLLGAGQTGVLPPLYAPTSGGPADGTGAAVDPLAMSFLGRPLAMSTPIGAMHPL